MCIRDSNHNVWVPAWPVIITICGWGSIIKGTWLVAFPNTVPDFVEVYTKNRKLLLAHSVLVIVLGALLSFLGYSAA